MVAEVSILTRFVEFLSESPSPDAILALKATKEEEERVAYLQSRLGSEPYDEDLNRELDNYLLAEQLMVVAKAKAYRKLKEADL